MRFRDAFHLEAIISDDALQLRVPGGAARALRIVTAGATTLALVVLSHFVFGPDSVGAFALSAFVAAIMLLYEPFEVSVRLSNRRLETTMRPAIYNWLAPGSVSLDGVTDVTAWYAWLVLHRNQTREFVFVPLSHLETKSGLSSNGAIARFVRQHITPSGGGDRDET